MKPGYSHNLSAVMTILSVCGSESAVLCLLHVSAQPPCMSAPDQKMHTEQDSLRYNMCESGTRGINGHTHSPINTISRHTHMRTLELSVYVSWWRMSKEEKKIIGLG